MELCPHSKALMWKTTPAPWLYAINMIVYICIFLVPTQSSQHQDGVVKPLTQTNFRIPPSSYKPSGLPTIIKFQVRRQENKTESDSIIKSATNFLFRPEKMKESSSELSDKTSFSKLMQTVRRQTLRKQTLRKQTLRKLRFVIWPLLRVLCLESAQRPCRIHSQAAISSHQQTHQVLTLVLQSCLQSNNVPKTTLLTLPACFQADLSLLSRLLDTLTSHTGTTLLYTLAARVEPNALRSLLVGTADVISKILKIKITCLLVGNGVPFPVMKEKDSSRQWLLLHTQNCSLVFIPPETSHQATRIFELCFITKLCSWFLNRRAIVSSCCPVNSAPVHLLIRTRPGIFVKRLSQSGMRPCRLGGYTVSCAVIRLLASAGYPRWLAISAGYPRWLAISVFRKILNNRLSNHFKYVLGKSRLRQTQPLGDGKHFILKRILRLCVGWNCSESAVEKNRPNTFHSRGSTAVVPENKQQHTQPGRSYGLETMIYANNMLKASRSQSDHDRSPVLNSDHREKSPIQRDASYTDPYKTRLGGTGKASTRYSALSGDQQHVDVNQRKSVDAVSSSQYVNTREGNDETPPTKDTFKHSLLAELTSGSHNNRSGAPDYQTRRTNSILNNAGRNYYGIIVEVETDKKNQSDPSSTRQSLPRDKQPDGEGTFLHRISSTKRKPHFVMRERLGNSQDDNPINRVPKYGRNAKETIAGRLLGAYSSKIGRGSESTYSSFGSSRLFTKRRRRQLNLGSEFFYKADVLRDLYLRWMDIKGEVSEFKATIAKDEGRLTKAEGDLLQLIARGNALTAAQVKVNGYNNLNWNVTRNHFNLVLRNFQKMKDDIHELQSRDDIAEKNMFTAMTQEELLTNHTASEEVQLEDGSAIDSLHAGMSNKTRALMTGAKIIDRLLLDDRHSLAEFAEGYKSKQLNIASGLSARDPDLAHVQKILKTVFYRDKRSALAGQSFPDSLKISDEDEGAHSESVANRPTVEDIVAKPTKHSFRPEDSEFVRVSSEIFSDANYENDPSLFLLNPSQLFARQYKQDSVLTWTRLTTNMKKFLNVVSRFSEIYSNLKGDIHNLQGDGKIIDFEMIVLVTSNGTDVKYGKLKAIKNDIKRYHDTLVKYKSKYDRHRLNEITRNVNEKVDRFKKVLGYKESKLRGQLEAASASHPLLPIGVRMASRWNEKTHTFDMGGKMVAGEQKSDSDGESQLDADNGKQFSKYVEDVADIMDLKHVEKMLNMMMAEKTNANVYLVNRLTASRKKRALRVKRRGRGGGRRGGRRRYYSSEIPENKGDKPNKGKQRLVENVVQALHNDRLQDEDLALGRYSPGEVIGDIIGNVHKTFINEPSYREILGGKDLLVYRNKDLSLNEDLSHHTDDGKLDYYVGKIPPEKIMYSSREYPYLWGLSGRGEREEDEDVLDNTRALSPYINIPPLREHILGGVDSSYLAKSIEDGPAALAKLGIDDHILTAAKQLHRDEVANANSFDDAQSLSFDHAHDMNEELP